MCGGRELRAALGGRTQGEEASSSFYRKGIAGDWKNHFSEEDRRVFKEEAGELDPARLRGGPRLVERYPDARLENDMIANQARELVPPWLGASYARVSRLGGTWRRNNPGKQTDAARTRDDSRPVFSSRGSANQGPGG